MKALVTQPHAQDDIGTGELLSNAHRVVDHEDDKLVGHTSNRSYRRSGMGAAMRRMLERESYFGALCRVAKTVLCGIKEFNCIPLYSI